MSTMTEQELEAKKDRKNDDADNPNRIRERDNTAYPLPGKFSYGSTTFMAMFAYSSKEDSYLDPGNHIIFEGLAYGDKEIDSAHEGDDKMPEGHRRLMPGDCFRVNQEIMEVIADPRIKEEQYNALDSARKNHIDADTYHKYKDNPDAIPTTGDTRKRFETAKKELQEADNRFKEIFNIVHFGGKAKDGSAIPKGFRNKSGMMATQRPLKKIKTLDKNGVEVETKRYRMFGDIVARGVAKNYKNLEEQQEDENSNFKDLTSLIKEAEVKHNFVLHKNSPRTEKLKVAVPDPDPKKTGMMKDEMRDVEIRHFTKQAKTASGKEVTKTMTLYGYEEKPGKKVWRLAYDEKNLKPMAETTANPNIKVKYDAVAWDVPLKDCPVYEFSMRYNGDIYIGKGRWIRARTEEFYKDKKGNYIGEDTDGNICELTDETVKMLADLQDQGIYRGGYTRIFNGPNGGKVAKTWSVDTNYQRRMVFGDRPKFHQPFQDEDGNWVHGNNYNQWANGKGTSWGLVVPLLDRNFAGNTRECYFQPKDADSNNMDPRQTIIRKPIDGEDVLFATPGGASIYPTVSGALVLSASDARPVDRSVDLRLPKPMYLKAAGDPNGTGFALLVDPSTEEMRNRIINNSGWNRFAQILTLGNRFAKTVGWKRLKLVPIYESQGTQDFTGDRDTPIADGSPTLSEMAYSVALQHNRERQKRPLTHNIRGKDNKTLQQKEVRFAENALAYSIVDAYTGIKRMTVGGVSIAMGAAVAATIVTFAGVSAPALLAAATVAATGWVSPQFISSKFLTKEDRELKTDWMKRTDDIEKNSSIVGIMASNPLKFFGDSVRQTYKGVSSSLYVMGGGRMGRTFQVMATAAAVTVATGLIGAGIATGGLAFLAAAPAVLSATLTGINFRSGRENFDDYFQRSWTGKPEIYGWLRKDEADGKLGITFEL